MAEELQDAGEHTAKARRESFNEISTEARKEATKHQIYREIPVPGKAFHAFCVNVAEGNKKKYKGAVFCR